MVNFYCDHLHNTYCWSSLGFKDPQEDVHVQYLYAMMHHSISTDTCTSSWPAMKFENFKLHHKVILINAN